MDKEKAARITAERTGLAHHICVDLVEVVNSEVGDKLLNAIQLIGAQRAIQAAASFSAPLIKESRLAEAYGIMRFHNDLVGIHGLGDESDDPSKAASLL